MWGWVVVDIYQAAKWQGKYLVQVPLFTDTDTINIIILLF